MIVAPIPENEESRLAELRQSGLLDSPQEKDFDEIVKFASQLCDMPMSLISLIDADRQWFKAKVGIKDSETRRDVSMCSHAILQDTLFEVNDTLLDDRFKDNPMVLNDPSVRFYAGMPLITSAGNHLGTLCVIDRTPRELSDFQRFGLKVLANNVMKITELRIKNRELYYHTETQKRIISILAHDVRNPLASIKNILELKQSQILDAEDANQMIDMVKGQLKNTIDMVDNVVNWGQAHLKFGQLELQDFDLHQLVEQIFGSEGLNSVAKKNTLINKVAPETYILSDARAIEFVIRNLVSNAVKFTQNGSISVSAMRDGIKTTIWIADTGNGMTTEQATALLEGNAKSTLGTNKEKGSGLGMLLIREFIERLNGTITVTSAINKGTTFKIDI